MLVAVDNSRFYSLDFFLTEMKSIEANDQKDLIKYYLKLAIDLLS